MLVLATEDDKDLEETVTLKAARGYRGRTAVIQPISCFDNVYHTYMESLA